MADSAPSRPRLFISAPAGTDLRPLLTGLKGRGASPYVLSDVAPLGADILQSLQQAIASADTVIVVLGKEPALDPAIEAGVAVALGKSLVILADPQAAIPSNLTGLLTVRARPDDLTAINFALDQAQGRSTSASKTAAPTGLALGPYAEQLLTRLADSTLTEQTAIAVLIEAIEASGGVAVNGEPDRGFDLGIWSDDLDAIAANPLLIEVKRSLRRGAVLQALRGLHATPSARLILLVYLDSATADLAAQESEQEQAHFPVLAVSLQDLIARMRTASFAEVIRDLRNRSVHGQPTS
jgi:hypothetical protein